MRDLVLAAGVDPAQCFSHPDRGRHRALSSRRHRCPAGGAQGARRTGVRVRRRFVSEGRCGLGEGLEPKTIKGPDTLVAVLEQARARIPTLFVLLTGPARGYVRGELERLRDPLPARAARFTGRARPRLSRTRRLPRHLTAGGRPEERARVDGRGRPARHDPRRPGAGARRRTARTACLPTSTTPTHSRPVCNECMTTASLHDVYVRPAARPPKRMPTSGSTRCGPSLLHGFVARGGRRES